MNTTELTLMMWGQELHASWRTARKYFIEENPVSLWSGEPVKDVHHLIPVHVCKLMNRQDLITDPRNFVGMGSKKEHYILGHLGLSWKTVSLQPTRLSSVIFENAKSMLRELDSTQYGLLYDVTHPIGKSKRKIFYEQ